MEEISKSLKSLIKSKEKELKEIDKDIINNINSLITYVTDSKSSNSNAQIEEYKKLLISKDNEISRLNDLNLSKENEIKRLNKLIEDMKSGSLTEQLEEKFKKEKQELQSKINNLELKIYNINDEKNRLTAENKKLNEKLNALQSMNENKSNEENKKENNENEPKEEIKNENQENNEENKEENNTNDKKSKKAENNQNENEDKENMNEENSDNNNQDNGKGNENENFNIDKNDSQKENEENNENKYEELLKIKENLEEKNKKLIEEINLLKNNNLEDGTTKKNSHKIFQNTENMDEDRDNNNTNLENKENIEDLKRIIDEYKSGKIISESTQKSIDSIKKDNLSQIEELKKKYETINTKNKNYESKIKILNDNLNSNNKNIKDLENIILKQENKINELNQLLKKRDTTIRSKEASISKNETYSMQLMNLIKEQKLHIQNLKKQKSEEVSSQIEELRRQITNLENIIELRDNTILTMKKSHKNLQDKYIKLCYNLKKTEQDNLLNQAKMLKQQKLQRDAIKTQKKNKLLISSNSYNSNLAQFTEESHTLSQVEYPNLKTNPNFNNNIYNEIKDIVSGTNDVVLPIISNNKSIKIEENNSDNYNNNKLEKENNLDEINELMKKVIDEN